MVQKPINKKYLNFEPSYYLEHSSITIKAIAVFALVRF